MYVGPREGGVLLGEFVEWFRQVGEAWNKCAIEVAELHEAAYFLECRGFLPFGDELDLDRVHCENTLAYDNSKEVDFSLFEETFLEFEEKVVFVEVSKNFMDNFTMFFEGFREY